MPLLRKLKPFHVRPGSARFVNGGKTHIFFGNSGKGVYGVPNVVRNGREFGGLFNPGEKVLEIHVSPEVEKARDVLSAIRDLGERRKQLLSRGFKGAYGVTNNAGLILAFERAALKNRLETKWIVNFKADETAEKQIHKDTRDNQSPIHLFAIRF